MGLFFIVLAVVFQLGFLLATRTKDNIGWWAVRVLLIHSVIAHTYLAWFVINAPYRQLDWLYVGFVVQPVGFCLAFYLLNCLRKDEIKAYKKRLFLHKLTQKGVIHEKNHP